jgi:hypothetical protein
VWTGFVLGAIVRHGFHAMSLLFLLVGVWSLLWIVVVEPYRRARRAYGVTDERVLLVQHGFRPRVEAYQLSGMSADKVVFKGTGTTRGTIRFADFAQRCGYGGDSICMPEFTAIPDAARVADLIRDAILTIRKQGKAAPRIVLPW